MAKRIRPEQDNLQISQEVSADSSGTVKNVIQIAVNFAGSRPWVVILVVIFLITILVSSGYWLWRRQLKLMAQGNL